MHSLSASSVLTTRRPLRERCNVSLRVTVITSPSQASYILITGQLVFHPEEPSERQSVVDPDLVQEASEVDSSGQTFEAESIDDFIEVPEHSSLLTRPSYGIDEEQRGPSPSPTRKLPFPEAVDELSDLQLIIPGLFVAFTHDTAKMLGYHSVYSELGFTHVLNVLPNIFYPSGSPSVVCACEAVGDNNDMQRLRLGVLKQDRRSRDQIRLTEPQLAIARDFLSLALPYSRSSDLSLGLCGSESQVLVTSSFDCPADAIAIIVCYLDFISAHSAGTILSYLDEECILDIWKETITEEWEVQLIEDAAWIEL